MKDINISVFTPTFNREKTLIRVFQSLIAQSYDAFEWIIIDDGSTDNTENLVKSFIDEAPFLIRYYKQENSGKHVAQNRAVDLAQGELFFPLDSDDTITPEALAVLWEAWQSIPDDERMNYSGVSCHCMDQFGNRIGSPWPYAPLISNDLEVYFKYHVTGEKWGGVRVDVMKQFKNAEVKGHFLDESTVWFRIAKCYQKLYIDRCLRVYEIGQDSVQKRTRESELTNAESKLHANLIYVNEFYDWYIKYDMKGLVKHSLKIVYYASLLGRNILFRNGIIHQVEPVCCKAMVLVASPYVLLEKICKKRHS